MLSYLRRPGAESIHIMREVAGEFRRPVMPYSIGKDSPVMPHLARKAFHPSRPPFPLLHVDTTWKFPEMHAFRDRMARDLGMELLVHVNRQGPDRGISPFDHGSALHTEALRQALDRHGFGGARRDEERSRAKERVFSIRSADHRREPRDQRPELWNLYNTRVGPGESIRVFPLSNWTETDIWRYIESEGIDIVSLCRAAPDRRTRRHARHGRRRAEGAEGGETVRMRRVRFRTPGCWPLNGAIESAIIDEVRSERPGRLIDRDQSGSMERKKREGCF